MKLKIDVDFNKEDIDDMAKGIGGLVKVLVDKLESGTDDRVSMIIPLGTLTVEREMI